MRQFLLLVRPKLLTMVRPPSRSRSSWLFRTVAFALLGLLFWAAVYFATHWLCVKCLAVEDVGHLILRKILSMVFLTFFSVLFFSNLIAAFTTFLLADDLPLVNRLPVGPGRVYAARLIETLVNSSWMILVFGLPMFVAYGVSFGAEAGYYARLLAVLPPFLVIPAAMAVAVALTLATLLPARRTRDMVALLLLLGFVALYLYFRFLKPERLLEAEGFGHAVDFLALFQQPSSSFLPSHWATASLFPALRKAGPGVDPIYLAALYSTAGAAVVLCGWLFEGVYRGAYSKAQEGRRVGLSRSRAADRLLELIGKPLRGVTRVFLLKDLKVFARDPSQWTQLLLLGALVVVYVFNFGVFKGMSIFQGSTRFGGFLAHLGLYFINLGLSGFVLSAVAVRFAFPSVSLEGRCFWLVRSSPVSMLRFLRSKFVTAFLPLVILTEGLTLATNLLLSSPPGVMAASLVTMLLLTIGVTGLGVGLGAVYPRFDVENPTKIAGGFGGVIYMILSMALVAAMVVLELVGVRAVLYSMLPGRGGMGVARVLQIVGSAVGIVGLSALACVVPLRIGAKRLEKMEL